MNLISDLDRAFRDWADSLTSQELEALRYYQGANHVWINRALRSPNQVAMTENQNTVIRRITGLVDRAISKGSSPFGLHVYRGMRSYEALFDDVRPSDLVGEVIHDPAFVSTSVRAHRADRFVNRDRGFRLDFEVPMGYPAAWLPLVGAEELEAQKELLLPRDTEVEITGATERESILYVEGFVIV